jgi:hypothetical protein
MPEMGGKLDYFRRVVLIGVLAFPTSFVWLHLFPGSSSAPAAPGRSIRSPPAAGR